jgi:hypothetical protein
MTGVQSARSTAAASGADLAVAGTVVAAITVVLLADRGATLVQQHGLGALTWLLLVGLLARERGLVRAQVGVVVGFATAVEYTFSPLLEVYTYRFDNVPAFVPPGHGLVYLAALAFGRAPLVRAHVGPLVALVVAAGGAWAAYGALLAERPDALGAFWFACLLGFLRWGRQRALYVGAFAVVSYLELLGTSLGTWTWQAVDPTGLVTIGNPPSGAAGGYGWFDLAAALAAPILLAAWRRHWSADQPDRRASTASWSSPLVATALPPSGPGVPSSPLKRPPASATSSDGAAMSCRASSGSAATSTAPSASSA